MAYEEVTAEWWPDDPGAPMYVRIKDDVRPGEVKRSVPRYTEIVLDYDENGNLLGFEILGIERR